MVLQVKNLGVLIKRLTLKKMGDVIYLKNGLQVANETWRIAQVCTKQDWYKI